MSARLETTDLLAAPPPAGAPPLVLARETGFALKLLAPAAVGGDRPEPPGQGQVLLVLRGQAQIQEHGGAEGRVVSTTRTARTATLDSGQMFRVANDARWTLGSTTADTLLLALSTSVPREVDRQTDVLALARRRRHLGPVRLFGNEVVGLDLVAGRGRLPLRGWNPFSRTTTAVEYFVSLQGGFELDVSSDGQQKVRHQVHAGSLLRLPTGSALRLRAVPGGPAVALVVTGRPALESTEVRREDARGFTPFG